MGENAKLVGIRRAVQADTSTHFAKTGPGVVGLTTAYPVAGTLIDASAGGDAELIPAKDCKLQVLTAPLTSVVTAVSVDWFLSLDADGDFPMTAEITTSIQFKPGSTAIGSVTAILAAGGLPYIALTDGALTSSIYLFARVNAGTADIQPHMVFTAATSSSQT